MWKYLLLLWAFSAYAQGPVRAILTDIEGTTTSISFVHDVLFPYAKEHVQKYLLEHQQEPFIKQIVDEVRAEAKIPEADLDQVTRTLLTWMEQDKKITSLKSLQGMMWKEGYMQGDFLGHVYEDAFQKLEQWKKQGLGLYVYSSGSVPAQKLLFSHSTYGDLTPLFSGYFDTKVGGKRESASYRNIVEQVGVPADQILFLSDTVAELDAAREAGMQTILLLREGEPVSIKSSHEPVADFFQISFH